jgi:hypothetical protein
VSAQLNLHDGFVDGVFISDSTVRIFLRSVTGEQFTLMLNEVDALRVNDFKKGNIIFELRFLSPDQLDADFVFEIYEYSEHDKNNFVLKDWIGKAKEKELAAIELTSSYGCSLFALFKNRTLLSGHVFV